MRRRILPILCLVVFCMSWFWMTDVYAASLDPDAKAELILHYQKDNKAFENLTVEIYRVAEAFSDGTFELIEPYASYPVNIHDITAQEQWGNISKTLVSYLVAERKEPDRQGSTNEAGAITFSDLKTGLYLVREVAAEHEEGTYIFDEFMVYLPTPQINGSFVYQVEARPKCSEFVPKAKYAVIKLWQDEGNEAFRPNEITVEIYKDGVLHETQILGSHNNWTYTWYVSGEGYSRWTVAERSVPETYTVTIYETTGIYSIVNTWQSGDFPPQTGDSFSPLPWILLMGFSGIMLLILGLYKRKSK